MFSFITLSLLLVSLVQADTTVRTIAGIPVRKTSDSKAFYWANAKAAIDADGASDAYNPSDTGIDYLANAGRPGNWWGITTNSAGTPYKQQLGDPHPGYYVSSTSLANKAYPSSRQCRYVDSRRISYVVIPNSSSLRASLNVQIGDFGLVHYRGTLVYTMYADAGPSSKIGEASIFVIDAVGKPVGHNQWRNNRVVNGIASGVTYLFFPQSGFGNGYIPSNREISQFAAGAFADFGGCARLRQLIPGVACTDTSSPNIRSQLDYKCGNAGVTKQCGTGGGVCASRAACRGFGGSLAFGDAACAAYPANVGCCSRGPGGVAVPPSVPTSQPDQPGQPQSHGACSLGAVGQCFNVDETPCAAGYVSNKCPGLPNNVRCCPSTTTTSTTAATAATTASSFGACSLGAVGQCLNDDVSPCATGFISNKCPGLPANVRCCPSPSQSVALPSGGQRACAVGGAAGTCIDVSRCPEPLRAFASSTGLTDGGCSSIPSRSVQCCAPPPPSGGAGGGSAATSGSCSGLYFPIADGSLREISVNWGFSRSSGRRCHAGVDIYTSGSRHIVAVGAGEVVAILRGWYSCSGGSIDAILVYHSAGPLAGKTINYGEMNPGTYSVSVGSRVAAGERLGVARNCGMLHFELYSGKRTSTNRWLPRSSVGSGCASTSLSTKPAALVDPRPLLQCLAPSNARYRHGISFLSDPEEADASLFAADLDDEIDDESEQGGLSTGAVVGVVIGVLGALIVLGAAVWCFAVRRGGADKQQGGTIGVANELYDGGDGATPAYAGSGAAGHFECSVCSKTYDYADDLEQHVQLRH